MLSRILGRLVKRISNTTPEERITNLTRLEQSKHHLLKMTNRADKSVNMFKARRIPITAIDKNILALSERIVKYAETIEANETLVSANFFSEHSTVTMEDFFIDDDGCYISTDELILFAANCKRLYAALDSIKGTSPNIYAYADRLLTKTYTSIQNVSIAVLEASYRQ